MFDIQKILNFLNMTQKELAAALGVNQSTIANIKSGRMNLPKESQKILLEKYSINVNDYIINEAAKDKNLSYKNEIRQVYPELMEVKVLKIEAQAGYLDNLHNNLDEMIKLDTMLMPIEYDKGNYLAVEVSGDSMNDGTSRSIMDGDILHCKELQKHHWKNKLHFNQYIFIIVGHDGIVCKQITKHDVELAEVTCHSWNSQYKDYVVSLNDVYQLFYVKKILDRRIKF